MDYGLPTSVCVGGENYPIRCDYRAILDIFEVLNDNTISDGERAMCALTIFYPDLEHLPDAPRHEESIRQMLKFITGGKEEKQQGRKPQLVAWERDFPYIVGAVNRVVGYEIRAQENFHWWSFLAAYMEIGDCLFSQIVAIRDKKAKGKKLDKGDKEFYKQNRALIDIPVRYTNEEIETLKKWGL